MARAELAMKRFNLRAEPFARLTWNAKTHRALPIILWEIEREAWRDFLGGYPEADPIPFVKGEGYCAQMKISCAHSFHT